MNPWERIHMMNLLMLVIFAAVQTIQPSGAQLLLERCSDATDVHAEDACRELVRLRIWDTGVAFPRKAEFYKRLGRHLEARREWDIAIRVYREGIQRFPDVAEFHFRLGHILLREVGAYEEALGPLSEAVRRQPRFVDAEIAYGEALRWTGRLEDACVQYQAALKDRPDSVDARRGLAQAMSELGRIDQATTELRIAVRLKPDDSQLYILLGKALARSGKRQEALQSFGAALDLPDAEEREVRCEMASVLRDMGRVKDGREECDRSLRAPALKHGGMCQCQP
jgi:tetratricopeptide (TPR) repeat protein